MGRSERPAEVGVGLAVQRVEAGAGAQINGVALAGVPEVGVAVVARRVQRPVQKPRHRVLVLRLARGTLRARGTALDTPRSHHGGASQPGAHSQTAVGGGRVCSELDAIRQAVQRLSFAAFSFPCKWCAACDTALAGLCTQSKSQSHQ